MGSPAPPIPFPIAHGAGNDLGRLRAAESLSLPLIEADVHLYRGRVEVRHLKTAGVLPVLWDRRRVASARGPRLELAELLAEAAPHTELVLDLKGRDLQLAERVLEALATRARAATTVCARAWQLLDPFRGTDGIRRLGSIGRAHQLRMVERRFDASRPDGISIHEKLLDPRTALRLGKLTPTVVTWPVRTLARAREVASWGVAGVITDDLSLARRLMLERLAAGERVAGSSIT